MLLLQERYLLTIWCWCLGEDSDYSTEDCEDCSEEDSELGNLSFTILIRNHFIVISVEIPFYYGIYDVAVGLTGNTVKYYGNASPNTPVSPNNLFEYN